MCGAGYGGKPFTVAGEYRRIERPRLLIFTWLPDWQEEALESLVRVPLTLGFCIYCGADPLVRAGPPGPAFGNRIKIRSNARKADEGVDRGRMTRSLPTAACFNSRALR